MWFVFLFLLSHKQEYKYLEFAGLEPTYKKQSSLIQEQPNTEKLKL